MKLLLVTYNLKNAGKDYSGFYNVLRDATLWWHYIDSTWLLKTSDSPSDLRGKLKPHMDEIADSLLIIEVNDSYGGWLPQKAWDWINKNI